MFEEVETMNQYRSEAVGPQVPPARGANEAFESSAKHRAPATTGVDGADVGKPTIEELGIDPHAAEWSRTGTDAQGFEVAFFGEWILVRLADKPDGPVLVYNHHEWRCFLDGAKAGEFDDVTSVAG
jgi:hypothetical protein